MPRIIHFEIPAEDPEKIVKFYTDTFGWEIKKWEGPMDYWLVRTGSKDAPGIDGGIFRKGENMKEGVNTLDVPDIEGYVEKVKQNGGMVLGEIQEIQGVGRFVYAKDAEGNKFGMMQAYPEQKMQD